MKNKLDQIVDKVLEDNVNAGIDVVSRAIALVVVQECANVQEGTSEAEFILEYFLTRDN